ncbi:MAG: hypothetical protein LBK72_04295, partial [Bifidobacteriaceae bacterium]|nr:hypothetical protein [Bifidobacteriaceae bacterium]
MSPHDDGTGVPAGARHARRAWRGRWTWWLGGAVVVGIALGGLALVLADGGLLAGGEPGGPATPSTPIAVALVSRPAEPLTPSEHAPTMPPSAPSSSMSLSASPTESLSRQARPTCGDVVFLGLRGSGEMDSEHG